MPEVYVYGVIPAGSWEPDGAEGVHGQPLRRLDQGEVAAIVSDVDDEVLGRRRELLAHTRVLEEALERGPVLPAQFGTVAPDDEAVVQDLLAARQDHLLARLADVEGLVEVRLSATYDEEAVLRRVVERQPQLQVAASGGVGDKMAVGRRIVEAIEDERRADAAALLQELGPRALEVREQSARTELALIDVAFLVRRSELEAFDEAVAEATQPLAERARLRYVGPLPPATFFSLET